MASWQRLAVSRRDHPPSTAPRPAPLPAITPAALAYTRLRVPPPLRCNPHHDLIALCNECTLQSLQTAITLPLFSLLSAGKPATTEPPRSPPDLTPHLANSPSLRLPNKSASQQIDKSKNWQVGKHPRTPHHQNRCNLPPPLRYRSQFIPSSTSSTGDHLTRPRRPTLALPPGRPPRSPPFLALPRR